MQHSRVCSTSGASLRQSFAEPRFLIGGSSHVVTGCSGELWKTDLIDTGDILGIWSICLQIKIEHCWAHWSTSVEARHRMPWTECIFEPRPTLLRWDFKAVNMLFHHRLGGCNELRSRIGRFNEICQKDSCMFEKLVFWMVLGVTESEKWTGQLPANWNHKMVVVVVKNSA